MSTNNNRILDKLNFAIFFIIQQCQNASVRRNLKGLGRVSQVDSYLHRVIHPNISVYCLLGPGTTIYVNLSKCEEPSHFIYLPVISDY